jgi:hypothetical protein
MKGGRGNLRFQLGPAEAGFTADSVNPALMGAEVATAKPGVRRSNSFAELP